MKRKITFLCAVFLCIAMLAGCGDFTSDTTSSYRQEREKKQEELQKELDAKQEALRWNEISEYDMEAYSLYIDPKPAFQLNWDDCFTNTKEDFMKQDNRVVDITFRFDEKVKTLFFSIEVVNGIIPHDTRFLASDFLISFDKHAHELDPTIPKGEVETYGGVYEKYRVRMNVYQTSEKDTPENWFIKHEMGFSEPRNLMNLELKYALEPLEPIPEK